MANNEIHRLPVVVKVLFSCSPTSPSDMNAPQYYSQERICYVWSHATQIEGQHVMQAVEVLDQRYLKQKLCTVYVHSSPPLNQRFSSSINELNK